MLKRDPNFQRVKIWARAPFSRVSYWLGPDHLLMVEIRGYTEQYRRFNYRDIQALVARRTPGRLILTLVLLPLMALFLMLATAGDSPELRGFGYFMTGLFLIASIVNHLAGPACRCEIRTAVQQERLPGINRLRQFQRLREVLTPAILAAQSTLPPLTESALRLADNDAQATARTQAPITPPPAQPVTHYHAVFHKAAFFLLMFESVVLIGELLLESTGNEALDLTMMVAVIGCLVGAAVKQARSDVPLVLRRLVWGSFAYYGLMMVVGFGFGIYVAVSGGNASALAELNPWDHPVLLAMDFVGIAFGFIVGPLGLREISRFRAAWAGRAPPALPAESPASQATALTEFHPAEPLPDASLELPPITPHSAPLPPPPNV